MEKFVTLLIPALVALVLVRLLLMPMKLIFMILYKLCRLNEHTA